MMARAKKDEVRCPIDGVVVPVGDGPVDHCPVCGAGVDIDVEIVGDGTQDHYTTVVGDREVETP